jgi:hypothetical protein
MSDVRINTRSPYYIEANPTEPTIPETPEIPDPPTNIPPTVTITASNENPYVKETVTLTAVATDSDGTIVSYLWGGTSSPQTSVSIDVTSPEAESKIFNVVVTDDDGDVAVAQITINWQEIPEQTTNTGLDVNCGDVINEGAFLGTKTYNLVGVGDKIGDVEIEFLDGGGEQNTPVKFDITWDGNTETTGFIGDSSFGLTDPIPAPDNTSSPTNKKQPTTLIINKTSATPTQVTLTAEPLIPNDSYSFRLNCPDVEETITKFYTVKSTTAGGTTDFSYTDVNGVTQTVSLEEGETDLVSAQEDTVSVTSGTGTIEEGGQSFDLGVPEQVIDGETEITIIFDSSGSMGTILDQLLIMADNELKNTLLEYYNNDVVEYNKRVKIVKSQDHALDNNYISINKEDFLKLSSTPLRNADSSKQIFLYFTNEVSGELDNYQDGQRDEFFINRVSDYTTANPLYDSDLANFRTFLESKSYGDYFLTLFNARNYPNYETYFINNIFSGDEGFDGSKGLSDRSEVSVVQPVLQTGTSSYYHDLIITALRGYGFNI